MVKRTIDLAIVFIFLCFIPSDIQPLISSNPGEVIDNLERSWEVRWFFSGRIPDEVESWFYETKAPDDAISASDFEVREDLYLVCSNGVFLSPKLREGKLEIKYREGSEEIIGPNGIPLGRGEYWKKWSWRYFDKDEVQNKDGVPFVSNFLNTNDEDLCVNIGKKRRRRKFDVSGAILEPVPFNKIDLPYGILTELTELRINGDNYWTLAFEVFGAASQPMNVLQQAVNSLIEKFPGPALRIENSYSYPEWIFVYLSSRFRLEGDWSGGLETPKGWIAFTVHFEDKDGKYRGALDIPPGFLAAESGGGSQALKDVSFEEGRLRFELPGEGGGYVFEGTLKNALFSGEYRKGDVSGEFQLVRIVSVEAKDFKGFLGEYELDPANYISIFQMSQQGEEGVLAYYDSETGRVGFFKALSETAFFSGKSPGSDFPIDVRAQFLKDDSGKSNQMVWRIGNQPERSVNKANVFYAEDVTYPSGNVTMAGSLRIPCGEGPFPAVVFVHGSGPGTRNQVSLIAHAFLHNGIAVLGFDKRGCGKSTGDWRRIDFPEMAQDVLAGVKFLRNHEKIDPRQVGLYGISQGGWIVSLAASLSQDVAFIISHSGPGVSPKKQEFTMITNILKISGISQEETDDVLEAMELMYAFGRTGEGGDKLDAKVRELQENPKLSEVTPPLSKEITWENLYEKSGQTMGDPGWFFHLDVDYDPVPAYKKVRCPALIIFGKHDFTVPVEESVARIEAAFKESGHTKYTIRVFANAGHGVLEVDADNPTRLASPGRFIPGYLQILVDWVKKSIKN